MNTARGRGQNSCGNSQQCRLPGAIGADQCAAAPGLKSERYLMQNPVFLVIEMNALQAQQRAHTA
jgi:hypothetical protein